MEGINQRAQHELDHISEYEEASERFKASQTNDKDVTVHNVEEGNTGKNLTRIIEELCKGSNCESHTKDANLFYDLIFHSDFIQIKTDSIEAFYTQLCDVFVMSELIGDIIQNLPRLNDILHVKQYLLQGFFKVLQVNAEVENDILKLSFTQRKIWKNINFKEINSILIQYCAYKMMKCNIKFSEAHFNFVFLLLEIEDINLQGFNFGTDCTENIFRGVRINKLNMSDCGFGVNRIIQNFPNGLQSLTFLNTSNSLLCNESLSKIGNIPLKSLNISGCIKTDGQFVNSVWFADDLRVRRKGERANANADLLWTPQEALSENIRILDVSFNSLSLENLKNIMKLNLEELNITKSIRHEYVDHVNFPNSLRILKARKIIFTYNQFKRLCELRLKNLEFDYMAKENEDFTCLINSPLLNTLTELSVKLISRVSEENFIGFISKCKLKYFECNLTSLTMICLLYSNPEVRKHLETFKFEACPPRMRTVFPENLSFHNLKELSLSLLVTKGRNREIYDSYRFFLRIKNLQESIVCLKLSHSAVKDEDLMEIIKFKRLEKLSFSFDSKINKELLKVVVEMKSLKEIELEVSSCGPLDIEMAQLLCRIPVKTLYIDRAFNVSITQTITDEAYEFLSNQGNTRHLNIETLHIRAPIEPKLIDVLKHNNWKKIVLNVGSEVDFFKILMDNENIQYSLEELFIADSNVVWEDLANLMLLKIELAHGMSVPSELSKIFAQGKILKFLKYLYVTLGHYNMDLDFLADTNLSQVGIHSTYFFNLNMV